MYYIKYKIRINNILNVEDDIQAINFIDCIRLFNDVYNDFRMRNFNKKYYEKKEYDNIYRTDYNVDLRIKNIDNDIKNYFFNDSYNYYNIYFEIMIVEQDYMKNRNILGVQYDHGKYDIYNDLKFDESNILINTLILKI